MSLSWMINLRKLQMLKMWLKQIRIITFITGIPLQDYAKKIRENIYVINVLCFSNDKASWRTIKVWTVNECASKLTGITLKENGDIVENLNLVGNITNEYHVNTIKAVQG